MELKMVKEKGWYATLTEDLGHLVGEGIGWFAGDLDGDDVGFPWAMMMAMKLTGIKDTFIHSILVFQVQEAHCQGIDLLQTFVNRLDGHALWLLDRDIHVQMMGCHHRSRSTPRSLTTSDRKKIHSRYLLLLTFDSRQIWPTFAPNFHPRELLLAVITGYDALHPVFVKRIMPSPIDVICVETSLLWGNQPITLVSSIIIRLQFST